MRKRWKGVLITCGILAVLGAGMCVSAAAIGIDRSEIPSDFFPHVRWLHENDTEHHENRRYCIFQEFFGNSKSEYPGRSNESRGKDQYGPVRSDTD